MDESAETVTYYEILNVPRDATPDQIRKAYRKLAQAFHPDKQQTDELRDLSGQAFAQLQEAYEVLSTPERRQIYDVYGRQGLQAGLEVGAHLDDLGKLQKEWELFQAKKRAELVETEAAPQSLVQIKLYALNTVKDLYDGCFPPRQPFIASATMSSSVQYSPAEKHVLSLGGHTALARRNTVGGGAVMVGTSSFNFLQRWDPTPRDAIQFDATYGLGKNYCSLSSIRTLSQTDTGQASLTLSEEGVGLQLVSRRTLWEGVQSAFTWVIGPPGAAGMAVNVSRRGERVTVSGKLEVGAVSAIVGRVVYKHNDATHLRGVARCATTGIDLELGVGTRWSSLMSTYGCVVHGWMGTTVKVKVVRAGHAIEVPLVLSKDVSDWRTMLLAYGLPPLASFVVHRCIVRPILQLLASRDAVRIQGEEAERLAAEKRAALAKQEMLAPMMRRLAEAEASRGGLVILKAAYGDIGSYKRHLEARLATVSVNGFEGAGRSAWASRLESTSAVESSRGAEHDAAHSEAASQDASQDPEQRANGSKPTVSGSSSSRPAEAGDAASRSGGGSSSSKRDTRGDTGGDTGAAWEPWLDVTVALQYLASEQRIAVPANVAKAHLLGFADLAPGAQKQLHVLYTHAGRTYSIELADDVSWNLPAPNAKELVSVEAERVTALAKADSARS